MDWDDIKIFLALSRSGSVRAAAKSLAISHTTVARRIGALEETLATRLFDRRPEGYTLTDIGERFVARAETIESEALGLEREVVGRDGKLSGAITVTLAAPFAAHLLMADFARFGTLYPDIELRLAITYDILDLARREADVAIRATHKPPENLVGRRGPTVHYAAYATQDYLAVHDLAAERPTAQWIGWDDGGKFPKWVRQSDHPHIPALARARYRGAAGGRKGRAWHRLFALLPRRSQRRTGACAAGAEPPQVAVLGLDPSRSPRHRTGACLRQLHRRGAEGQAGFTDRGALRLTVSAPRSPTRRGRTCRSGGRPSYPDRFCRRRGGPRHQAPPLPPG